MADDILRFTTAGSVDDGKSTLIGRLLLDCKAVPDDQMAAIQRASRSRGDSYLDLALLTDGLKAEREQGITIDVAYRYFSTSRRSFIIADTPGHVQYTRNMVTGASTADLAIVLIDARHGVLTQSRRHGFIANLLGIPHLLVAVNKMDLVDFSQTVFDAIVEEYRAFASRLSVPDLTFIPISALHGDNVVDTSARMPWYKGPSLLSQLEQAHTAGSRNMVDFRFPVQMALRSGSGERGASSTSSNARGRTASDFRGYAGQVASGSIDVGEEIAVLPSGAASRVAAIFPEECRPAIAGDSVILVLEHEIDVSRGDLIVRQHNRPRASEVVDCTLCWMGDEPMRTSADYLIRHGTRTMRTRILKIEYRIDVDTLHRQKVETLALNDIGRVILATASPLHFDPYQMNRAMGSFILIDPVTNATVAAGMIRAAAEEAKPESESRGAPVSQPTTDVPGASGTAATRPRSENTQDGGNAIDLAEWESKLGHAAAILWFTGLSGSGKTTIARLLERRLFDAGARIFVLDGDALRHGLCGDLGFSEEDRRENIRRAAEVAGLAFQQGCIVLCSFVSPYARDRDFARSLVPAGSFFEIHVDCDVDTCAGRDPKGLYAKARAGGISHFTGLSAPYEVPEKPELRLDTRVLSPEEAAETVLGMLRLRVAAQPGQNPARETGKSHA